MDRATTAMRSRRTLFTAGLGMLVLAGGITAPLAGPPVARANDPDDVVLGSSANTAGTVTKITNPSGIALMGASPHIGVYGSSSSSGIGVYGDSVSGDGAEGVSNTGYGVHARSQSGTGVYATSQSGTGVYGSSGDSGIGVQGESDSGYGVEGVSDIGYGVHATSSSGRGVSAFTFSGTGVYSISQSGTGVHARSLTGYGLQTYGRLDLNEISGVATIPIGSITVTVALSEDVTDGSFAMLTPWAKLAGRDLWFSLDTAADTLTIKMSSSRTKTTKVSWLLLG